VGWWVIKRKKARASFKKIMATTYLFNAETQHDTFEQGTPSYYVTNVTLFIYGAAVVASLVLLQNATVLHTNTLGNNYGPLYSDRFVTQWWWALFFNATRIMLFMCVCALLLYRKTSRWCNILWLVPITIFVVMDLGAVFMLGGYLGACNGQSTGNFNNPCNSYNWCCDVRIYSRPENHCRPTAPCPPGQAQTLEQMKPNSDFLWLFAINVISLAFDIYFLVIPALAWCGPAAQSWTLDKARERFARDFWLRDSTKDK
jgi:hypothetical protein